MIEPSATAFDVNAYNAPSQSSRLNDAMPLLHGPLGWALALSCRLMSAEA